MRKIVAASAVAAALVAGQALAANGAAQTLSAGDRVGAALGAEENFQSGFPGFSSGMSFFRVVFGFVFPVAVFTKVAIEVADLDDDDESPS